MAVFAFLVIVGASSFIGWQIKNFYVQRNRFFADVSLFCEVLLNETNFNLSPLKRVIEKNEKAFHKEFLKSLGEFERAIDNGEEFKEHSLILNQREKEMFENFLNSLGKCDLENHNNLVNSFKKSVASKISKEMEEEKKRGNAYFKISICVGLMIAVLCL